MRLYALFTCFYGGQRVVVLATQYVTGGVSVAVVGTGMYFYASSRWFIVIVL